MPQPGLFHVQGAFPRRATCGPALLGEEHEAAAGAAHALQAMRGMPDARLVVEVGVELDATRPRPWMSFIDNGPGIAADVLAKLTREPVTTKAHSGGSGMGLMFCHRVMQSIGGSIEVDSTVGAGTTATLYFRPES